MRVRPPCPTALSLSPPRVLTVAAVGGDVPVPDSVGYDSFHQYSSDFYGRASRGELGICSVRRFRVLAEPRPRSDERHSGGNHNQSSTHRALCFIAVARRRGHRTSPLIPSLYSGLKWVSVGNQQAMCSLSRNGVRFMSSGWIVANRAKRSSTGLRADCGQCGNFDSARSRTPSSFSNKPGKRMGHGGFWPLHLREAESAPLQRQGADALAGGGEDGVRHRGQNRRQRRLAQAGGRKIGLAPEDLDRRRLAHAHHRVLVDSWSGPRGRWRA